MVPWAPSDSATEGQESKVGRFNSAPISAPLVY